MPRKKKQLQYHRASKRWAKRYKDPLTGKKPFKYLGPATPKADGQDGVLDELYDLALERWKKIEQEIEVKHAAVYRSTQIKKYQQLQEISSRQYSKQLECLVLDLESGEDVKAVDDRDIALNALARMASQAMTVEDWLAITDEIDKLKQPEISEEQSLMRWADDFIEMKRCQVVAGMRSAERYQELRSSVTTFIKWLGPQASIDDINPVNVEGYYQHQLVLLGPNYSQNRARDAFQAAKQFIRWLGAKGIIPNLPGNIDSRELTFRVPNGRKNYFSRTEIGKLLDNVEGRNKLFVLLALNCGMYPKDISDLRPSEVDWNLGRIHRNRSKTSHHLNVPVVCYKLWPETFKILKKHGRRKGQYVLRGRGGKALVYTELRDGDKIVRVNAIYNAFTRFKDKNPDLVGNKTFSDFRKTSATWLRNSGTHAHLVGLFLGHAPHSVADRFYAANGDEILDEALDYLRLQVFKP